MALSDCTFLERQPGLRFFWTSDGEKHADGGAAAELAFGADRAAVQQHDVLHDREAEPGAAEFTTARLVRAVESLENARHVGLANADAFIGDADVNAVAFHLRAHRDGAAALRIFDRVIEQVVNDLLQPSLVRVQQRQVGLDVPLEAQLLRFQARLPVGQRRIEELAKIDFAHIQLDLR